MGPPPESCPPVGAHRDAAVGAQHAEAPHPALRDAFNRRHHRAGHLFQNRYKSIVVEAEPYLLELVRYLHLNPLRAKALATRGALDRAPWTGHSALLGTVPRPWQDTRTVLAQLGPTRRRARQAYRTFVQEGVAHARRPDLQGGGLVRSLGGWDAVRQLRRGREAYLGDERILGSSDFVDAIRREVEQAATGPRRAAIALETVMARVCDSLGIVPAALVAGGALPGSAGPGRASPTSG